MAPKFPSGGVWKLKHCSITNGNQSVHGVIIRLYLLGKLVALLVGIVLGIEHYAAKAFVVMYQQVL
jgi:hypothetical protein